MGNSLAAYCVSQLSRRIRKFVEQKIRDRWIGSELSRIEGIVRTEKGEKMEDRKNFIQKPEN